MNADEFAKLKEKPYAFKAVNEYRGENAEKFYGKRVSRSVCVHYSIVTRTKARVESCIADNFHMIHNGYFVW